MFPVSDQSFFQINIPVAEKAYDIIRKNIKKDAILLDAYSGVGSIGYYMSRVAKRIKMIESNKDAILMANKIKSEHHLEHIDIVFGQAEKLIQQHEEDVLIIDPPRNGLMPELVSNMMDYPFEQVFYLSCDLKTLSRDLGILKNGYDIEKIYPIRMFPQTTETETLVIMKKKSIKKENRKIAIFFFYYFKSLRSSSISISFVR